MDIPVVNSAAPGTASVNNAASSTLGKFDFLKILAAELQNQDPFNPTSNTEFVAQLAQFGSLEQMQKMSEYLGAMSLMQSAGMIGKYAVAEVNGYRVEGVVESILIKDSMPHAIIDGITLPVVSINKIG